MNWQINWTEILICIPLCATICWLLDLWRHHKIHKRPAIISYEQIDCFLDTYNPALRQHDGKTFAIEVANAQRDADVRFYNG